MYKGTIKTISTLSQGQPNNVANGKVIFKNCAAFTNSIMTTNNTQVDDAHDVDVVISMYDLIEYIDNYSETSGILWQYCRDETDSANDNTIAGFTEAILLLIRLK